MDPITIGLLAGAGMGLVKGGVLDAQKEKRQRKRDAELARFSPWTGMGPMGIQEADPLGSTMQGAMGGAMLGQGIGAASGAGGATAAGGAEGAALTTADPAMQASLTGGQSSMAAPGTFDAYMQQQQMGPAYAQSGGAAWRPGASPWPFMR